MSITYNTTTSVTSANIRSGCTDETNNQAIIVERTSNTLRKFDLTTGAQVGGNVTLQTNPQAVCLIAPGSAIVGYSTAHGIDFVELATGYVQNYPVASAVTPTNNLSQFMASDLTNKIAFIAEGSTSNAITRINGNNFTVTRFTNLPFRGGQILSIMYKSAFRWLVATSSGGWGQGMIFEIDENMQVVDSYQFTRNDVVGLGDGSSLFTANIGYMTYSDNILAVTDATSGELTTIDWTTKTILSKNAITATNIGSAPLSNTYNGVCILARENILGANHTVYELDFTTRTNTYAASMLFLDTTSSVVVACGINTTNGRAWVAQTGTLRFFTITPTPTTTITVTVQDPPGTNVKARLWLLQDDGVGNCKVNLDTYMQSPAAYRTPTGKTIRAVVKVGEGNNAKYQMSVFNT